MSYIQERAAATLYPWNLSIANARVNSSLHQVIEILSAAKFITPELGELPPALKARLGDSNKNLVSLWTAAVRLVVVDFLHQDCIQCGRFCAFSKNACFMVTDTALFDQEFKCLSKTKLITAV